MESGQEQYSGHQVKLSITNAVVNREQKAILVAMNQGICSISWGNVSLRWVNYEVRIQIKFWVRADFEHEKDVSKHSVFTLHSSELTLLDHSKMITVCLAAVSLIKSTV